MGWEERNGRSYYYRKVRRGDQVVSVYVGSGEIARLYARSDELLREKAEAEAARRRAVRKEGQALAASYDALALYVRVHVRAFLLLEGFRTHKGQWRRRRYPLPPPTETELMPKKKAAPFPSTPVPARVFYRRGGPQMNIQAEHGAVDDDALAAAQTLVERCNAADPDPADLAALRRWIERDDVMIAAEALAGETEGTILGTAKNAGVEEMARRGLLDLRRRMGYDGADPVERLLIRQAGVAWAWLQVEQARLARYISGSYTVSTADALDKRVNRAHSRFIRATEALERIRALRTVTADRVGEATPRQRAAARAAVRAEIARRKEERANAETLPAHTGDGAALPAEAARLALTAG